MRHLSEPAIRYYKWHLLVPEREVHAAFPYGTHFATPTSLFGGGVSPGRWCSEEGQRANTQRALAPVDGDVLGGFELTLASCGSDS